MFVTPVTCVRHGATATTHDHHATPAENASANPDSTPPQPRHRAGHLSLTRHHPRHDDTARNCNHTPNGAAHEGMQRTRLPQPLRRQRWTVPHPCGGGQACTDNEPCLRFQRPPTIPHTSTHTRPSMRHLPPGNGNRRRPLPPHTRTTRGRRSKPKRSTTRTRTVRNMSQQVDSSNQTSRLPNPPMTHRTHVRKRVAPTPPRT